MADQCIVCLETLDSLGSPRSAAGSAVSVSAVEVAGATADTAPLDASVTAGAPTTNPVSNTHDDIAVIDVCGHTLHDTCLREWTGKANSCPICRQSFHLVHVFDKVGGALLSSYKVEDRKQVAEFDPQAWIDANIEEEESIPCPVCNLADQEEVLLLCDGCDTPYHTHCIGLDDVPHGAWYCMECVEAMDPDAQAPMPRGRTWRQRSHGRGRASSSRPRTLASQRRARRRDRTDAWQGAWGQITGHVLDALDIDVDANDGDEGHRAYRRAQQLREREHREYRRWQQRFGIARRLGAEDVFVQNMPNLLIQPAPERQPPAPIIETREERRAWGALERAREREMASPGNRKRKSRSITGSPVEPAPAPERRPKRPRTRRIIVQGEASSSKSPSTTSNRTERDGMSSGSHARSPQTNDEIPSFLSSLLKEVEMSTPSDDENIRLLFGDNRLAVDPSSPGSSPTVSAANSPRALSTTPPPHRSLRPSSPTLLSSHIEPIYPPANYSPTRSGGEASDFDSRSPTRAGASELRQPRPRRQQPAALPRSQDSSPTRTPLSLEMKENISSIVRDALKPHWKSSQLTADQYSAINRDVSRKLYEEVVDAGSAGDDARGLWEKKASVEVDRAMSELKA